MKENEGSVKPEFEPIYGAKQIDPHQIGVRRTLGKISKIIDEPGYVLGMPFLHDLALLPKEEEPAYQQKPIKTKDNREIQASIMVFTKIVSPRELMEYAPYNYQESAVLKVVHHLEKYVAETISADQLQAHYHTIAQNVETEVNPVLKSWGLEARLILPGTEFPATKEMIALYRQQVVANAEAEGMRHFVEAKYAAKAEAEVIRRKGEAVGDVIQRMYEAILAPKTKAFNEMAGTLPEDDRVVLAGNLLTGAEEEMKRLLHAAVQRTADGYFGQGIRRLSEEADLSPVISAATKVVSENFGKKKG